MWKPVRVVSANFLKRISEPASPFYSDFLAYRNGEITQADLIARLPHIARSATACAQESMSHRSGARFGARELAVEIIGFSTVIRHQQAFRAFRNDSKSSLPSLRLNAQASARWSIMKGSGRIFSEESFGHAISPGKLAPC